MERRFNRARYNAGRIIAAFAARLQHAVDLDAVRADLASSVQQALEPAHLSVWIPAGRRTARRGTGEPDGGKVLSAVLIGQFRARSGFRAWLPGPP